MIDLVDRRRTARQLVHAALSQLEDNIIRSISDVELTHATENRQLVDLVQFKMRSGMEIWGMFQDSRKVG